MKASMISNILKNIELYESDEIWYEIKILIMSVTVCKKYHLCVCVSSQSFVSWSISYYLKGICGIFSISSSMQKKNSHISVPNYCQSVCPKQTTLEEDRELFGRFSSILCLWFEIQGRRTDNFFDWVLNTFTLTYCKIIKDQLCTINKINWYTYPICRHWNFST